MNIAPAWPYLVRPMQQGESGGVLDAVWRAFGWGERTGEAETVIAARSIEVERTLLALDTEAGGEVVGTASIYSLSMTMPGGALASVAGVHLVTVMPTHRRRGVASAMMAHQLGDLADAGEAVAALWTTQAGIYGRYGYGIASWRQRIEVDLSRAQFTPRAHATAAAFPGRLVQMAWPDAAPDLAAVHERVLTSRPGMLTRSRQRWEHLMREDGRPAPEIVVATGLHGPTGYATYRIREGAPDLVPTGEVAVQEVSAVDPATHARLWRHLLDLDLMATLSSGSRPLPDPLVHLLADHRRLHARLDDALWVRIVDLPRALSQRAFAAPVDLVLAVTDEDLPANAGRWHVAVGASGDSATVKRTRAEADLSLDIADLGAAHLGASHLHDLALAGRVVEHTPGALAAASTAWAWSPTATCLEIF